MADLRIDLAAEFKGKKAFSAAEKSTVNLTKTIKKLAGALGIALSVQQVVAFGKASLKAFSEDEKSAKRLSQAVKNLGLQMSQPAIDNFIAGLEKSSSIADDDLRPAFQALLTTTGSLSKSQELLKLAIDGSRGSGEKLSTVAQDLAQAYVGNNKGLTKYYLGLTKAELKTMSFAKIQQKFSQQFSGSNAEYLSTYAGKMDALKVAAGNAQEIIGKGLVDALGILGGTGVDNIKKATSAMEDLSTATADVIRGQAVVLKNLANLFDGKAGKVGNALKVYFKEVLGIQALQDLGKEAMKPKAYGAGNVPLYQPYSPAQIAREAAARKKAEDNAKRRQKEILAAQLKNTLELKKQAALKKAGTVFDLEQIQLIAALKGKLSAEERIRVEAQLAILNENDVLAKKLTEQILMAQDATGGLYRWFLTIGDTKIKNPFDFLDKWIIEFQNKLNNLKFPTINPQTGALQGATIGAQGGIGNTTISPTVSSNAAIQGTFNQVFLDQLKQGADATQAATLALSSARYAGYGAGAPQVINVTVQGSVIREQELVDKIMEGTQLSSLSGSPSQIGRIQGMFSL